jgi:hypothetical protein
VRLGVPSLPAYQPTISYQLAFRTPGIIPFNASSRKQIRHRPNRRRYARDRPQRPQRLCCRTANFGFRLLFSIMAFRAIANSPGVDGAYRRPPFLSSPLKGMPSSFSSASAWSSRVAVVTNVMSMPWICSIES